MADQSGSATPLTAPDPVFEIVGFWDDEDDEEDDGPSTEDDRSFIWAPEEETD